MTRWLVLALAGLACSSKKRAPDPMPEPPAATDGGTASLDDAAPPWPALEGYPLVQPVRVVHVPAQPDTPRFDVGGPVIAGDVAVVSSSQAGFVAIDWRRGAVAWTKPAGLRIAPPVVVGDGVVLIGDCTNPPQIPEGEAMLGCLRVVTALGTDQAYLAIRGKPAAIEAFGAARGTQMIWPHGDHAVTWRRGDVALTIDLVSGIARPADPAPPPLHVEWKAKQWDLAHEDGRIVARAGGKQAWATQYRYTAMLGAVWLPEQSPMLRLANIGAFRDAPEIHILDIDATGSLRGQAARPAPGIGILGWGMSPVGDAAIAVRLDTTLRRDAVVGYAANALLMWVYPLPDVQRVDPVGVAITADAVVVFHDGDTLTILPELSAPPTSPGAARAPSRIPTP